MQNADYQKELYNHKIISFPNLSYTNASFFMLWRVMGTKNTPLVNSDLAIVNTSPNYNPPPPSPPFLTPRSTTYYM